jgi:hypothetical protein
VHVQVRRRAIAVLSAWQPEGILAGGMHVHNSSSYCTFWNDRNLGRRARHREKNWWSMHAMWLRTTILAQRALCALTQWLDAAPKPPQMLSDVHGCTPTECQCSEHANKRLLQQQHARRKLWRARTQVNPENIWSFRVWWPLLQNKILRISCSLKSGCGCPTQIVQCCWMFGQMSSGQWLVVGSWSILWLVGRYGLWFLDL